MSFLMVHIQPWKIPFLDSSQQVAKKLAAADLGAALTLMEPEKMNTSGNPCHQDQDLKIGLLSGPRAA